jgi:hypothetical protein
LKAYPYGFASRFEGVPGTNPEELLAAAHAGCNACLLFPLFVEKSGTQTTIKSIKQPAPLLIPMRCACCRYRRALPQIVLMLILNTLVRSPFALRRNLLCISASYNTWMYQA